MQKKSMEALKRKTVAEVRAADKVPLIALLDNVRSKHNVGSVFRTADAFLLSGIYLCGYTPVPPDRDIQKTALGATESVHWKYFENTIAAIEHLKLSGYEVWAVEQVNESIMLNE